MNKIEYHVDSYNYLATYIQEDDKKIGGSLSIRQPVDDQPLLLIGQDELSYHQFVFSKKLWKDPDGHNFILPKGLDETLMILGFQSRTFGLDLGDLLNVEIQYRTNISRREK